MRSSRNSNISKCLIEIIIWIARLESLTPILSLQDFLPLFCQESFQSVVSIRIGITMNLIQIAAMQNHKEGKQRGFMRGAFL